MLSRGRLIFFSISVLTLVLFAASTRLAATAGRGEPDEGEDSFYKYLSVFTEVLGLVDRAYVDEVEMERLMAGAFEGAADALDPFSLYVPASAVEAYEQSRKIGARRSGLLVLKERGVAYAASIEEGSPADDAGLQRGDIVAMVDGEETRGMPLFKIHTRLAAEAGTVVKIETIRMGLKNEVELKLADYAQPGVELRVEDGAAVLRIPSFHDDTPANVTASLGALAESAQEGAQDGGDGEDNKGLEGLQDGSQLVVDLRGVAGGEESVAYQVAALFTNGELGVLQARDKVVESFTSDAEPRFAGRLVVLIDRGSQGPAEVLAKVLHERLDAAVVGMPSFGHSGRLRLVSLSNGGRLQLTDAFYTGPDREPIVEPIKPDLVVAPHVAADDEEGSTDAILEKGIAVLRGEVKIEEKDEEDEAA